MVNHYTRRGFLEAVLGVAGSAALSGCVPSFLHHPEQTLAHPSQPSQPTLDERVASITTLNFKDLKRTPITPKAITVFYEVENHPDVHRNLLESALLYVEDFYSNSLNVTIYFIPVVRVHESKLDKQTTFGLRYLSPRNALRAVIEYEVNPAYFGAEEVRDLDKQVQIVRDFAVYFKDYVGVGEAVPGVVVLQTPPSLMQKVQTVQGYIDDARKLLEEFQNRHPKRDISVSLASFPADYVVRDLAQYICHELGHLFGLFHPFHLKDSSSSETGPVPEIYDNGLFRKTPNFMSYEAPYEGDPDDPTQLVRHSISLENPLGYLVDPLQRFIIHNYLAGGITFRTLQQQGDESYREALARANNLAMHYPPPKSYGGEQRLEYIRRIHKGEMEMNRKRRETPGQSDLPIFLP